MNLHISKKAFYTHICVVCGDALETRESLERKVCDKCHEQGKEQIRFDGIEPEKKVNP